MTLPQPPLGASGGGLGAGRTLAQAEREAYGPSTYGVHVAGRPGDAEGSAYRARQIGVQFEEASNRLSAALVAYNDMNLRHDAKYNESI